MENPVKLTYTPAENFRNTRPIEIHDKWKLPGDETFPNTPVVYGCFLVNRVSAQIRFQRKWILLPTEMPFALQFRHFGPECRRRKDLSNPLHAANSSHT